MLRRLLLLHLFLACHLGLPAAPLRIVLSAEENSFRDTFAAALRAGGAEVNVAAPSTGSLAKADVLVLQRSQFLPLTPASQQALAAFASRGGGIVALHAAVAAGDEQFGKELLGGAWTPQSRKFTSRMMLCLRPEGGPITRGASSFDLDDDTLYDLSLDSSAFVLASAFTPKVTRGLGSKRAADEEARAGGQRASVYDVQPQMWTWEGPHHRAAVLLQGSATTLAHPSIRTFVLRSVSWTARHETTDELCRPDELARLRYPPGGPSSPADAAARFRLQPGFKASAIAAEPLISKPIAIQWDPAGRLWVAETPEYPNGRRPHSAEPWRETGPLEPGRYDRPARDSISILRDTDGDSLMDTKTVWHSGIELASAFCFHRDGIIAVNYPDISWIRDTDGDGKADTVVPLFGGVPFPNHYVLNHFVSSPDGWIYASSGTRFLPTRPGRKEPLASLAPGIIRFRPDGSAIEQVGSVGGNSFGLDLTSDLELFLGMATSGNPLQHLVLPEWVLAQNKGGQATALAPMNPNRPVLRRDLPDRAPLMQIGGVGHYSSACASMLYEGGAWPAVYDRTLWCTEPILDIVHHERLRPDGPAYKADLVLTDSEWLRSEDYWFCPVDVTAGPDGALYVLDFYTPAVAHNDTRSPPHGKAGASIRPDRDHYFGRIYRIQHEAATKLENTDLNRADTAGLVAAFSHPNRTVRFHACRLLLERAPAEAGPLLEPLLAQNSPRPGTPAAILSLWSLHRLGKLTPARFDEALRSPEAMVRKNALLIAEAGRLPLNAKQSAEALADGDARTRLAALRALFASGLTPATTPALLAAQPSFADPWSKAAASALLAADPAAQLATLFATDNTPEDPAVRAFARSLAERRDSAATLALLRRAKAAPLRAATALRELGANPPPPPNDGLAPETLGQLRELLARPDPAVLPLATAWDQAGQLAKERASAASRLRQTASATAAPASERANAARTLLLLRRSDPAILPDLLALLLREPSEPLASALIPALAETGENAAGQTFVKLLPALPAAPRGLAFNALAERPAWTALLLDTLEKDPSVSPALSPAQLARLRDHPDGPTAARARKILAAIAPAPASKEALIASLLPAVSQPGDAAHGRTLFASACSPCHRFGNEGNDFGPALDGMGAHPPAELLIHIIDPNRSVDAEHLTWHLTLRDGTLRSGLIASENTASLTLRQPGGACLEIPLADIAKRRSSPRSLMPEGFEALGGESLRDLIAFLRSRSSPPR